MARTCVPVIARSILKRQAPCGLAAALLLASSASTHAQTGFANFETPQVSPLAITPDGTKLLLVNTADGFFDGDERSACSDSANAASFPGARGVIDVNADFVVNTGDIFAFLGRWFAGDLRSDFDGDQRVDVPDIFVFLAQWFNRC